MPFIRHTLRAVLAAVLLAVPLASAAVADTLDRIQERKVLVVGVKADFKPWGFVDPDGRIVGLEIDLAQDIADRLGVALETVAVTTANRIEFLRQGKIDLILATMSDSPKRRETVGVIEPPYYAGGTAILAPRSLGLKAWTDLRGRRVCGVQGAYYNRRIAELYGAEVVAFAGVPEAQTDLFAGNCVAFVQDSTLITSTLASDAKWAAYESPLPLEDEQVWVLAVPLEERDGPYGRKIAGIVTDWHRAGRLIELERRWGIPATPFVQAQHLRHR